MPIAVAVPRLGWNMEEGTFVGWLKADGEAVRPGDRVFQLEGDKAVEEVESLDGGVLHIPADGPKPGDRVKVGAVIGQLLQPGEQVSAIGGREPTAAVLASGGRRHHPGPGGSRPGSMSTGRRSAATAPPAGSASGTCKRSRRMRTVSSRCHRRGGRSPPGWPRATGPRPPSP
ncbi:MAG: lipoyl domain-containing protein [Gemmataceae bacterium]|nr:lipoyl domain-containing protein [Gemmataceae bacterium]